ncbi:unnamed protein product [Schistosoma mattheei]|uniref:Uncharacterized protein n=1 Tax=Schistosoma mattheei TaxID=31246 RepID=A0A3P8EE93_9TREM|nr:unnamed protein product [Schistosoma mattheei]
MDDEGQTLVVLKRILYHRYVVLIHLKEEQIVSHVLHHLCTKSMYL